MIVPATAHTEKTSESPTRETSAHMQRQGFQQKEGECWEQLSGGNAPQRLMITRASADRSSQAPAPSSTSARTTIALTPSSTKPKAKTTCRRSTATHSQRQRDAFCTWSATYSCGRTATECQSASGTERNNCGGFNDCLFKHLATKKIVSI